MESKVMNFGRLLRKFYFYNYFRTRPTYTVYSHCVKSTRSMCTCNLLQCQDFRRSPLFLKHATDIKHTQAVQSRQKSKKSSKIQDNDSDDEGEEDDDGGDDVFEDLPGPDGYKYKKIHSLRIDNLVAHTLGYSNNETQKLFYSSKLLLDGDVLLKKSKKVKEGDTVEVIVKDGELSRKVRRLEIVKISDKSTRKDKPIVYVRLWRGLFDIDDSVS